MCSRNNSTLGYDATLRQNVKRKERLSQVPQKQRTKRKSAMCYDSSKSSRRHERRERSTQSARQQELKIVHFKREAEEEGEEEKEGEFNQAKSHWGNDRHDPTGCIINIRTFLRGTTAAASEDPQHPVELEDFHCFFDEFENVLQNTNSKTQHA